VGENAPKVEIELDKTRHMMFTFGVAKKFKELTGKAVEEIDEDMTFDEVSVLLYLMLQVEDPELTQEQADNMLHIRNAEEYGKKIGELMGLSIPESETPPVEGEVPKAPEIPISSSPGPMLESVSE